MSVCSQDWPDHYPSLVFGRCPFWNKEYGKCKVGQKSDACPHAPALRAVLEDPTLVLVAVEKGQNYEIVKAMSEWSEIEFMEYQDCDDEGYSHAFYRLWIKVLDEEIRKREGKDWESQ